MIAFLLTTSAASAPSVSAALGALFGAMVVFAWFTWPFWLCLFAFVALLRYLFGRRAS